MSALVTTFRPGASVVVVRGPFAGMHGSVTGTVSGETRVDLWAWGVERSFAPDALALTAARRATWPKQRQELIAGQTGRPWRAFMERGGV